MEMEENSEKQSRVAVYSNSFKIWQATAEVSLHLTNRLLCLLLFLASFFLALLFNPKNGVTTFPRNIGELLS
jgi:hypothetical protein